MIRLDYAGTANSITAAAACPQEYVEFLVKKTSENFRQYALGHRFMLELAEGQLSLEQIKGFLLNWYTWTFEINMATATWLHRFGPILKTHPDIAEVLHEKIADELITPTRRGHIETLETFGTALGLKREELINARLIPEARAWLDYFVRLVLEGTFAECVAGYLGEGCFPEFAKIFEQALTTHYGLSKADVKYFRIHGEQDEVHGPGNQYILRRLIETGNHQERPGWGIEYVTSTGGQLFVAFLDGVYRRYNPQANSQQRPS
jgi:pyrroloquinoline quinone (PQQ) biosynthesis protein C